MARLIEDIISEMSSGKPQHMVPSILVCREFLEAAEDNTSDLSKELEICRKRKIKVVVRYADELTPPELVRAKKLFEDIPLYSPEA